MQYRRGRGTSRRTTDLPARTCNASLLTRIDDMTWVILTGRQSDLDQVATPHKIITNRDYLAHPALFRGQRPKVINLSNNYGYQSRGYYASLLASSRSHRVIPTVETMIDLSEPKLYEHALPELEVALNKCRKDLGGAFPHARLDLLRHRPVEGLGPLRQAPVRLVPRAGAGGHHPRERANGPRSARSRCCRWPA